MNWVLNIGNELGARGHNITFLTADTTMHFGRPYPNVKTVSTGPPIPFDHKFVTGVSEERMKNPVKFLALGFGLMFQHFEKEYEFTKEYFTNYNVDLALCDHFSQSCIEAAKALNIPYIVTSTLEITKDSSAPYINNDMSSIDEFTTEFQSFSKRFINKIVNPFKNLYYMWPTIKMIHDRKKAIGIPTSYLEDNSKQWENSLKLVNTLFGFQEPRPLSPLVEFVGPIIPKHYTPLNEELQQYLDAHKNVAYIAFGQNATPSEKNIILILHGLLESMEQGSLDGFIWATVHAAGFFPDSITTSSNTTYVLSDLFEGKNSHIRFIKWAPQTAILLHPSTNLFVSHGGIGSWYESMYAGTRMIMFPFFGDQPGNSLMIERYGLGAVLKLSYTTEQAVELFKKIAADEDGKITENVKRHQALIQIRSKNSVARGADIVEEVVYTHKNGIIPHRQTADKRMPYFKAHNLDIYGALLAIMSFSLFLITYVIKSVLALFKPATVPQKLKKL
ncbi:MAG: hypothetical protein EXX96DRAFT_540281 [Benjaminiella poitrasii]|nr:MAG: hypothetical protein EXX96DRAFT_540281 [Benjaminiella poitrasii]